MSRSKEFSKSSGAACVQCGEDLPDGIVSGSREDSRLGTTRHVNMHGEHLYSERSHAPRVGELTGDPSRGGFEHGPAGKYCVGCDEAATHAQYDSDDYRESVRASGPDRSYDDGR